jgi:hypothetical protein
MVWWERLGVNPTGGVDQKQDSVKRPYIFYSDMKVLCEALIEKLLVIEARFSIDNGISF